MDVKQFDYLLPEELIAQEPAEPRDCSRLLVLDRTAEQLAHRSFHHLPEYLRAGDVLVFNDTKVIPARLVGKKEETGAVVEVFLLHPCDNSQEWEVLVKPGRKARAGAKIVFGEGFSCEIQRDTAFGGRVARFEHRLPWEEALHVYGKMPLPPYITKEPENLERYQTVYAAKPGAVAAPTAGLHFTPRTFAALAEKGISTATVTLHVGLGTFRPVKESDIRNHQMHAEFYSIPVDSAKLINRAKAEGRRVIAVGTTSVRALESAAVGDRVEQLEGWTEIFLYPGKAFHIVDGLLTNFHLPQSTLLMLVSAFAGHGLTMRTYGQAVHERYRFFSFGDAMLIL